MGKAGVRESEPEHLSSPVLARNARDEAASRLPVLNGPIMAWEARKFRESALACG